MVKPTTHVTVHDKFGEAHTFSPNDELPDWAVKKIDNPAVLPDGHDGGGSGRRRSDSSPATGSTPTQN